MPATMNDNQERKKYYDMQQAQIMRGIVQKNNKNNNKKKSLSSTLSAGEQPQQQQQQQLQNVFQALEDLDQAEIMARHHGLLKGERIPIHQLEKARDVYREAIGRLLDYVNHVTGCKNKSRTNIDHDKDSSRDLNNHSIQMDVLKERIKLALTHAEEIQEEILQRKKVLQISSLSAGASKEVDASDEQIMTRTGSNNNGLFLFSKSCGKQDVTKYALERSKSENMHGLKRRDQIKNRNAGDCGFLVTSASADDSQKTKRGETRKKRSNLDYNTNDPFIQIIKKDLYIDSKSIHTTWNDISGLKSAKQALQEAAILPLLRPDLYTGLRSAPRGILLYGPPGTGKTMLVRAVAHESQCILFACTASSMTSKWVGEAEKLVRTLFRMAADVAPSIIFLDEMDALLGRRKSDGNSEQESSRRFKTEFMIQMDGLAAGGGGSDGNENDGRQKYHAKTLLIGCTNCPWDVDDAVMRRFQRRIYVPLPDKAARRTLWQKLIEKSRGSVQIHSRDLERLVELSQGFSCSDISSIANEASFGPLRDLGSIEAIKDVSVQDVRPIQMKDFEDAIRNAKKSVSMALLKRYDEWESAQAAAVKV